jgi:carbazole 1,9a-dioxygenase ferredoxin component
MPDMNAANRVIKIVCETGDVAHGCAKRVELEGLPPLAVFNVDGEFYVTDDTCTHGDASLCEGDVEGGIVECPFHQGAFDVRTGKVISAPCSIPLKTYDVTITNGTVAVEIEE